MEKKNIYEKLQQAKCELQKKNLKKTGKNIYSNFTYFELSDVIPSVNEVQEQVKLSSFMVFNDDVATLIIVNSENADEKIEYKFPVSKAILKGCQDIQNWGATQTYIKRYLYFNAFDILEVDELEPLTGKESKGKTYEITENIKKEQEAELFALGGKLGLNSTAVTNTIKAKYNKNIKDLTQQEYKDIKNSMEIKTK